MSDFSKRYAIIDESVTIFDVCLDLRDIVLGRWETDEEEKQKRIDYLKVTRDTWQTYSYVNHIFSNQNFDNAILSLINATLMMVEESDSANYCECCDDYNGCNLCLGS